MNLILMYSQMKGASQLELAGPYLESTRDYQRILILPPALLQDNKGRAIELAACRFAAENIRSLRPRMYWDTLTERRLYFDIT